MNGNADLGVYCRRISTSKNGTIAIISAPRETFGTNSDGYLKSDLIVYARNANEGIGSPVFRGKISSRSKSLKDGRVEFLAHSDYYHLRNRSTAIREALISDDGAYQTFVDAGYNEFLDYNPFTPGHQTFINWTPSQILEYFATFFMESEFAGRISFHFDPTTLVQAPYTVPTYVWQLNGSNEPELVLSVEYKSSLGDQVLRMMDWGSLIDYISHMMPGVQVYENFTNGGTELWFAPPFRNGNILASAGMQGFDWRDVGANISELTENNDNTDTVNRFIGIGAPASFTITIPSNVIHAENGIIGLKPGWELFDTTAAAELVPIGIEGLANYEHELSAYVQTATTKQRVVQVYQNPNIADTESASYKDGYEDVGKKWRLPNWFAFCDIERGADMFSNPKTGNRINAQVFIEKASPGANGNWAYEWMAFTGGVTFDWENKTFSLNEIPFTYVLHENPTTMVLEPWTEHSTIMQATKLCRVALTVTYNTRHYVPYADTYIESGNVIDPQRLTAINSGNPVLFERLDMKFHQISNIGKPLWVDYRERYYTDSGDITANGGWSYQEAGERVGVIYDWFIVEAYKQGFANVLVHTTPEAFTKGGYSDVLTTPLVLRDDTPRLHRLVWDLYWWRGKLNRSFGLEFGWFVKAAKRGMMMFLRNLGMYTNDWDAIATVTHDLEMGKTYITTTNQPGNELDIITVSRD